MPCPLPDHPGFIAATATAIASPGVLPVLMRDATLAITGTTPATPHIHVRLRGQQVPMRQRPNRSEPNTPASGELNPHMA